MAKFIQFILIIMLVLSVYVYATVSSSSRADINHNVVLIPHHIGNALSLAADKITEVQNDYHAE